MPASPPALQAILDELRPLEPIFHTPEFGNCPADFDCRMTDTYWEVGASGTCYTRSFILDHLQDHPPALANKLGWTTSAHALMPLGPETYLLTYLLHQGDRRTRRATIWQRNGTIWQILYHQGTLAPLPPDSPAPA